MSTTLRGPSRLITCSSFEAGGDCAGGIGGTNDGFDLIVVFVENVDVVVVVVVVILVVLVVTFAVVVIVVCAIVACAVVSIATLEVTSSFSEVAAVVSAMVGTPRVVSCVAF